MAAPIYRLSRRAIADLEQIADYVGKQSRSAADRIIDELFRSFDLIAAEPDRGISLNQLRPNLRMLQAAKPAAKYLIFYYSVPGGVMISGVIHAARDWPRIIARGDA